MSRTASLLLLIALGGGGVAWRVVATDGGRAAASVAGQAGAGRAADTAERGLVDEAGFVGSQERAPLAASGVPRETRRLRARLVHADGEPVARRSIDYLLTGTRKGRERRDGGSIETDGEGFFAIAMPARLSQSVERRLELRPGSPSGESLVTALPEELAPGEHDLGELALELEPLIVAGTVVDSRGGPVAGAQVKLPRQRGSRSGWRSAPVGTAARTDRNGRFEIRNAGFAEPTVLVGAQRYSASSGAPVEVPRGTADLVLAIRATGSIRGRILHGGDEAPANLRVVARRSGGGDAPVEAALDRNGAFQLLRLAPGTYTCAVVAGAHDEPCFVLEDVVVREGTSTLPALFDPLDLRGVLRPVYLRLKAVDRNAVTGEVLYRESGARDAPWQSVRIVGRGTIVTAAPALDLRVQAFGYRQAELSEVVGHATIELAAGYTTVIAVQPPKERECRYEVALSSLPDRTFPLKESEREEERGRLQTRVTLSEPGPVRIRLTLRPRLRTPAENRACIAELVANNGLGLLGDDGALPGEPVVLERTIDVRDVRGEQTFWLEMSAAEYPEWSRAR